jgi:hypothetical protein
LQHELDYEMQEVANTAGSADSVGLMGPFPSGSNDVPLASPSAWLPPLEPCNDFELPGLDSQLPDLEHFSAGSGAGEQSGDCMFCSTWHAFAERVGGNGPRSIWSAACQSSLLPAMLRAVLDRLEDMQLLSLALLATGLDNLSTCQHQPLLLQAC